MELGDVVSRLGQARAARLQPPGHHASRRAAGLAGSSHPACPPFGGRCEYHGDEWHQACAEAGSALCLHLQSLHAESVHTHWGRRSGGGAEGAPPPSHDALQLAWRAAEGELGVAMVRLATLLRAGHRVCATDRALGALETTAAADGWGAIADGWSTKATGWSTLVLRALDVTQPQAWSAAFDAMRREWGGVDTVLNFAGLLIPCAAQRVTAAHVDAHLDVMAKGAIFGTVAAARCFADQPEPAHGGGGGHIVNVSSLGAVAPVQGVSLYQVVEPPRKSLRNSRAIL